MKKISAKWTWISEDPAINNDMTHNALTIRAMLHDVRKLEAIIEESNDMLMSCAEQFLMQDDHGILTHSYMSTEERLCSLLVERGLLVEVSRGKFKVAE